MTIEELIELINQANWFSRLGEFSGDENRGLIAIPDLSAWSDDSNLDVEYLKIADAMRWIPTTRDEKDIFYGGFLKDQLKVIENKEIERLPMDLYKLTLKSLRNMVDHKLLHVGPHHFVEAAKGAALYASRHACMEIVTGNVGHWCRLMPLYCDGFWPCGLIKPDKIVVL